MQNVDGENGMLTAKLTYITLEFWTCQAEAALNAQPPDIATGD